MTSEISLRASFRRLRRAIPDMKRGSLSRRAVALLCIHVLFRVSHRIGLYWPMPDEISPLPLLRPARQRGKKIYLPVIRPFPAGELGFAPVRPGARMRRHRWGFREPVGVRCIRAAQLDLLVMPLTAYDMRGNRLGMGGGFYDRTLRQTRHGRPFRLGLAFDCQRAEALPANPWDQPLDGILTPTRLRRFSGRRQP